MTKQLAGRDCFNQKTHPVFVQHCVWKSPKTQQQCRKKGCNMTGNTFHTPLWPQSVQVVKTHFSRKTTKRLRNVSLENFTITFTMSVNGRVCALVFLSSRCFLMFAALIITDVIKHSPVILRSFRCILENEIHLWACIKYMYRLYKDLLCSPFGQ